MKKVRLIVNRAIQKNGVIYTPDSEDFILSDKEAEKFEKKGMVKVVGGVVTVTLSDLDSVTDSILAELTDAGIETVDDLKQCDVEALIELNGIGQVTANKLLAEANGIGE